MSDPRGTASDAGARAFPEPYWFDGAWRCGRCNKTCNWATRDCRDLLCQNLGRMQRECVAVNDRNKTMPAGMRAELEG